MYLAAVLPPLIISDNNLMVQSTQINTIFCPNNIYQSRLFGIRIKRRVPFYPAAKKRNNIPPVGCESPLHPSQKFGIFTLHNLNVLTVNNVFNENYNSTPE